MVQVGVECSDCGQSLNESTNQADRSPCAKCGSTRRTVKMPGISQELLIKENAAVGQIINVSGIESDAELQSVLLACYEYWKTEPLPPEERAICYSWVIDKYRDMVGRDFDPAKLYQLTKLGLLTQDVATRGGNRRYYKITNPALALLSSIEQLRGNAALLNSTPGVLLQAVIVAGNKTREGQLIEAVALPWFEIIELIQRDPQVIYQLDWRKWEEIIAGAYKRQGFEVILTPRSNDKGRDIIASSQGIGCIRYFDQVKAYGANHLVTADDVRAMVGVLSLDGNVSKGIVTTTSNFAPGIMEDENIRRLTPYRLELKPRDQLLRWLGAIAARVTN